MKKLFSILLLTVLLLSLCACSTTGNDETHFTTNNSQKNETSPPQTTITSLTEITTNIPNNPSQEDILWDLEMPEPFEHFGGGHDSFHMRYIERIHTTGSIEKYFREYLGLTNSEALARYNEIWPNNGFFYATLKNGLMETRNLFSTVIAFDIPNDVVIEAIRESNEFNEYWDNHDLILTNEEIAALLTRDETIVTAHFAEETAIVIGDRAFAPVWVYYSTPADYKRVGITPQTIQEKLPLYVRLGFTTEATAAFEQKLSAFTGQEVSFAEIAQDVSREANSRS
jgi:uncharacterized protein YneR